MVLGLLMREQEERRLVFDFEAMLPDDSDMHDENDPNGRKDFKRGTVVCRHWLRGLCMKGDNCEFLHQYDMSKMPECRWGMECQVPECPFRHVPDEERVECAFYRQGFCSHGPNCRYRHIKLAREECPETADFTLQSKVADEENVKRRKSQPQNEFFKIAICKHWEKMGSCPFNDECHFAHGEKELRPFPKGERDGHHHNGRGGGPHGGGGGAPHGPGGPRPQDRMAPPPPAMAGHRSGAAGIPPPLMMPDQGKFCKYFLVHSLSYQNVADAVQHSKWSLPQELQRAVKFASETCDDVFLFLTVMPSKHFQAVARLAPGAMLAMANATDNDHDMEGGGAGPGGEDLSVAVVPYQESNAWRSAFSVEWLRVCECPWERLAQFENQKLPIEQTTNAQELDADVGQALMRLLFHQPPIPLTHRAVEDEQKLAGGAEELATRRREAAESGGGGAFGGPVGVGGSGAAAAAMPPKWNVTSPGFVFTCSNATIDECFGRMLLGLTADQEPLAATSVAPGTLLFLLNTSDHHLLGIFEAVTPPVVNMIPGAFASVAAAGQQSSLPSPLPVHVRFAVALNAPAINTADPQIQAIVGDQGVAVGPLTLAITQKLADAFAERMFGARAPGGGPPPGMGMGMNPMGMPPMGPSLNPMAMAGPPPPQFRRSSSSATATASSGGGAGGGDGAFLEKMLVGIEPDNDFGVTRRIIGPAGSHMKRISQEAGGGAKIKVRGRGSGSKESTEDEANEPLMIIVSAENERSFRVACELTGQLLSNIHRDFQLFRQRHERGGMGDRGDHRGGRR